MTKHPPRLNPAARRSRATAGSPPQARGSAATGNTPFSARRLDAYTVALELLSYMAPRLQRIAGANRELKNQLERSLPSILNNLSEAMRRTGADRPYHLTVSLGSADEARASIDTALAFGLMEPHEAAHADNLADRYCAMVYRLRQRVG